MRRFFVPQNKLIENTVTLEGEELHHLKNVCRLEVGEKVELLDGQGHQAHAIIKSIEKRRALLEVTKRFQVAELPVPHLKLVLCLPRFQKMDEILQKCVELGVKEIFPVFSERSFIKKRSADLDLKIERWNKIGIEACKQSGRAWPLKIHEPQSLLELISKSNPQASLFLYEGEARMDIKTALSSLLVSQEVTVFIGAEGGFSMEEISSFQSLGFQSVTLGDLVLRVETACIAAVSIIKYHFNLMR